MKKQPSASAAQVVATLALEQNVPACEQPAGGALHVQAAAGALPVQDWRAPQAVVAEMKKQLSVSTAHVEPPPPRGRTSRPARTPRRAHAGGAGAGHAAGRERRGHSTPRPSSPRPPTHVWTPPRARTAGGRRARGLHADRRGARRRSPRRPHIRGVHACRRPGWSCPSGDPPSSTPWRRLVVPASMSPPLLPWPPDRPPRSSPMAPPSPPFSHTA
jgi:hypothetical protein